MKYIFQESLKTVRLFCVSQAFQNFSLFKKLKKSKVWHDTRSNSTCVFFLTHIKANFRNMIANSFYFKLPLNKA